MVGVHLSSIEEQSLKRLAFVEPILAKILVLSFTKEAARIHAEIYSFSSKKGMLIEAHNLIIAATAVSLGYRLLTRNLGSRECQALKCYLIKLTFKCIDG